MKSTSLVLAVQDRILLLPSVSDVIGHHTLGTRLAAAGDFPSKWNTTDLPHK